VLERARQLVGANLDGARRPNDVVTIRGWVAEAPAGLRVRLAQLSLIAWGGASLLVQLIPGPAPSPMGPLPATLFVLQWLIVTLWIPAAALVWGRRRRGLLFAAALLAYSLAHQTIAEWWPWLAGGTVGAALPFGFPGARRTLKLSLTLLAAAACLFAAPRQPD
jgi:ABC-type branched-subunit amino acid transport system permease subunit